MGRSRFEVLLTSDAEEDLEEITEFIEAREYASAADGVFGRISSGILGLDRSPTRGRVVPELREIGLMEFREVVRKPYRIVFYVDEGRVYVVAILDDRRDLEELLARRLLR